MTCALRISSGPLAGVALALAIGLWPALAESNASARKQAIELRAELSARLEDARGSRNVHDEWLSQLGAAQDLMDQATRQHGEKSYAQAVMAYREALATLDGALERADALLAEYLHSGKSLLNDENYEEAADLFREAQHIQASHPEVSQGLNDAQHGIEAASMLREAERLIKAGDLDAAQEKLAELPSSWKSEQLQRVQGRIAQRRSDGQFTRLMDKAHEAMAASEWGRAREVLQQALNLRPDSQVAEEWLARAQEGAGEAAQREVEAKVRALLAEEQWCELAEAGEPLLSTPSRFVEDVQRAGSLCPLEKDLDRLLEAPEKLNRRSLQARIDDVATRARSMKLGLRLGDKFDKLRSEKERWSSKVRVSVYSDADATLRLHSTHLGKVTRRKPLIFEIAPGDYPLAVRREGQKVETCSLALRPGAPVSVQLKQQHPCQIQAPKPS